jgi:hypothetical protein
MLRSMLFGLLLSATPVLVQSCSDDATACTLIGCGPALEIDFTGETSRLGLYAIDLVTDRGFQHCEVMLPFACDKAPACPSEDYVWAPILSGCGSDSGAPSIDGLAFYDVGPSVVDLTVTLDGYVIGHVRAEPTYTETRPNGPDCEPVCRSSADVEVELAP